MTGSMVLYRRAGIERDAGLLAERADRLQRAVHMRPGLHMHGDDVGAGLGEGLEIGIAGRDHQMHVEQLLGVRPQRLHHVGTDADVGHEMAVHDVDMDPVGAGRIDGAHLLAELGEIGGQDRRRDEQRAGIDFLLQSGARLTRCRQAEQMSGVPLYRGARGETSWHAPMRSCSAPASSAPRSRCSSPSAASGWRWSTGAGRARRPPTAMPGSSRATRSSRRHFRRACRALLRIALKRAPEANYHLGHLPQAAPWLMAFFAASRPQPAGRDRAHHAAAVRPRAPGA